MRAASGRLSGDCGLIDDPRLVLIGSGGRNAGKTRLAVALVARYAPGRSVYALKVTGVDDAGGACQRGGAGCGACAIVEPFVLRRETGAEAGKDTALMLAAGARAVWWLRSRRNALEAAYAAFLPEIPPGALLVAESNSLRHVVRPAVFVMLNDPSGAPKASARAVARYADLSFQAPLGDADIAAVCARVGPIGT